MKYLKKNSILTSAIIVSAITIISKFIGFGREAIIAAYYGANSVTDAFFFAQNMPAMMFPAVCSSISTAFISMYVTKIVQEGPKLGDIFASRALLSSLMIAFILSIIALIFTPYVVPIFAPGFDLGTMRLAIRLTRLTMGSFVLIMAHYMLSAILNSKKLFYISQMSGLLSNIFVIIVTIIGGNNQEIDFLTLTVVAGHFVQIIILYIYSRKTIVLKIIKKPFNEDIKSMIYLTLPILMGNSVVQIQNIVDKALASGIGEGAISALSYSNNLNNVVITVFVTTLSTVLYPTLTEEASKGQLYKFSRIMINGISMLVIFLVPITIITSIFSENIVSAVYERGSFNRDAAYLTGIALKYYALNYVFVAVREILVRGFYAIGDTKTPMKNGSIAVAMNILFSIVLSKKMGIAGIALGTSISGSISAFLLFISIKRKVPEIDFSNLKTTIYKIVIAAFFTVFILILLNSYMTISLPFLRFIFATVLGFLIYFVILFALRVDEFIFIIELLKKKIMRR